MEAIVKYIFIGKQKVILCLKFRENQRETPASALSRSVKSPLSPISLSLNLLTRNINFLTSKSHPQCIVHKYKYMISLLFWFKTTEADFTSKKKRRKI
jgi:hypothetical protein